MTEFDLPLSPSKIKAFGRCPEAFRLGYIEDYPEMGEDNRWIRRGNAVHEAIEDVALNVQADWDADYIEHKLRRAYEDNGDQEGYSLDDEDHEFVLDALAPASRYFEKFDPRVVATEAEVEFTLKSAGNHRFVGHIDMVGSQGVTDWKTGDPDGEEENEAIQGMIYALAFTVEMGYEPEYIRFAYLGDTTKVRSVEPSDTNYEVLLDKVGLMLQGIENDHYPPKPPDPCYHCDYEVFCSASPVGGGGIDWEDYP
jgi:RecB family exonuclease